MAELFAIVRSSDLTPQDRMTFDRIGQLMTAYRKPQLQTVEDKWYAVGTVSHHEHEFTMLGRGPANDLLAWIGEPPPEVQDPWAIAPDTPQAMQQLLNFDPPFAFCKTQLSTRRFFVVSDPFGLHPVYYASVNNALVVCTKSLPITQSHAVPSRLCREALLDFLTFEHVTGDRTLIEGIKLLPPGAVLEYHDSRIVISRYFTLNTLLECRERLSLTERAHRFHDLVEKSVHRAVNGCASVVVPLSGGLDSRALLASALDAGAPLRTFTYGVPGCADIRGAREIARAVDVEHEVLAMDGSHLPRWLAYGVHSTGGMVNCIHYHTLALADRLDDRAVILDGLGGDAFTGAYLKWKYLLKRDRESAIDCICHARTTGFTQEQIRGQFISPDFLKGCCYDPRDAVRPYFEEGPRKAWVGAWLFCLLEHQRRFIQFGPHLLRPFCSIRTPFYAYTIPELMLSAPAGHLVGQRAYLCAHARHWRTCAGVPVSAWGTPPSWPFAARFGRKACQLALRSLGRTQFVDSATPTDYPGWFRTSLAGFLQESLIDRLSLLEGIIQSEPVERLFEEHLAGTGNHATKLGLMLTLTEFLAQCQQPPETITTENRT